MTVKTLLLVLICTCITTLPSAFCAGSYETAFDKIELGTTASASLFTGPDTLCPSVKNIQVTFFTDGKGSISWDLIHGVTEYYVQITDDDTDEILADTTVAAPPLLVEGFKSGHSYTVKICYKCPFYEEIVCTSKRVRNIIVEDLIVMFDGKVCNCSNYDVHSPSCGSSELYDLASSRTFSVSTPAGYHITFVFNGSKINPVGNCENTFQGQGVGIHSIYTSPMPYYDLGGGIQIYFHGSQFCVQGSMNTTVTYCDLPPKPSISRNDPDFETHASIQPNPFDNYIRFETLNTSPDISTGAMRLFDATGRLVAFQTYTDNPFSSGDHLMGTEQLAPGLYWFNLVTGDNKVVAKRMVKM